MIRSRFAPLHAIALALLFMLAAPTGAGVSVSDGARAPHAATAARTATLRTSITDDEVDTSLAAWIHADGTLFQAASAAACVRCEWPNFQPPERGDENAYRAPVASALPRGPPAA